MPEPYPIPFSGLYSVQAAWSQIRYLLVVYSFIGLTPTQRPIQILHVIVPDVAQLVCIIFLFGSTQRLYMLYTTNDLLNSKTMTVQY